MVVIGIDIGDKFCVVSRESETGSKIVLNDRNERKTNSYVSFGGNKREFGIAAKNLHATNIGSTFNNLKRSISEIRGNRKDGNNLIPTALKFDIAPFYFKYKGQHEQFNSIQLLAMLLSELKSYAETEINTGRKPWDKLLVTGCNISIPMYFSSYSQKALLLAAGIAGLSVHSLVKETTSIALAYGWRKKFLKTTIVAFVDFGHMSVQTCIWKFTNHSFECLAESYEPIGGKDIDEKIAGYFIKKIQQKQLGPNFWVKFLDEIEILKIKMSSDTVPQKLNIGLLLNDENSEYFMDRSQMENICKDLFEKIEDVMKRCLEEAKMCVEEIDSIELIGGSTRIPKVQEVVEAMFLKQPVSTMNRDEAVARGCILKRDFKKNYPNILLSESSQAQNLSFGSSSHITINEVHPNYSERKEDCLILTRDNYTEYRKKEKSLKIIDMQEKKRDSIRNELASLIRTEKTIFCDTNCQYSKGDQDNILRCNDKSYEYYKDKLDEMSIYVEQEKERKRNEARDCFKNFIRSFEKQENNFNQTIRSDLKHDKSWNNGTTDEYEKKLDIWNVIANSEKERSEFRDRLSLFVDKVKNTKFATTILQSTMSKIEETESWLNGTVEDYTRKFEEMEQVLTQEKKRSESYETLIKFIKTNETMVSFSPEMKSKCENIFNWKNGRVEDYIHELDKFKDIVALEKERKEARLQLLEFIELYEDSVGYILKNSQSQSDFALPKKIESGTALEYKTVLNHWQETVLHEEERMKAREALFSYIQEEESVNGLLVNVLDDKMTQLLQTLKLSQEETTEFYEKSISKCRTYAFEEKNRRLHHQKLLNSIEALEKRFPNIATNTTWKREISEMKNSPREGAHFYQIKLKLCEKIAEDEEERIKAREDWYSFLTLQEVSDGFPKTLGEDDVRELSVSKGAINGNSQYYKSLLKKYSLMVYEESRRLEAYKILGEYMEKPIFKSTNNESIIRELDGYKTLSNGSKKQYEDALVRCELLESDLKKQQNAYNKVVAYKREIKLKCSDGEDCEEKPFNDVLVRRLSKIGILSNEPTEYYEGSLKECQLIYEEELRRHNEYKKLLELFRSAERNDVDFYYNNMREQHSFVETWHDATLAEYEEEYSRWSQSKNEENSRIEAQRDLIKYLEDEVSKHRDSLNADQTKELQELLSVSNESTSFYINKLAYWKNEVYVLEEQITIAPTSSQVSNFFNDTFVINCRVISSDIKMKSIGNATFSNYINEIESFYDLKNETNFKDPLKGLENLLSECLKLLKEYNSAWRCTSKKLKTFEWNFQQLKSEIEKIKLNNQNARRSNAKISFQATSKTHSS